jgi:hypothetical protein
MSLSVPIPPKADGKQHRKETLIKGRSSLVECVDFCGQTFAIERGLLSSIRLEDEWYEDLHNPEAVIAAVKQWGGGSIDLLSFWQRLPDLEPKHLHYHREDEHIAALPITTYENWWNHQIKSRVRSLIRKSEKMGVTVTETQYDDPFVKGLTQIFNESPIRQGRKFWHYGKDFNTVKTQFSRYIYREYMLAAHYEGEMIGAIMLGNAGAFGLTGQIISSIKHRDKAPNNALIAKAVEVCAREKLQYLSYLYWSEDSLSEFKRRCGFEKLTAPRYYVPLTKKGEIMISLGLHRGWRGIIPQPVLKKLKHYRRQWNDRRSGE